MAIAVLASVTVIYAQGLNETELPVEQIRADMLERAKPDSPSSTSPTSSTSPYSPSFGDYFEGYSRTITYDRMIPPYGLEVTFDKTVHIIFPASIIYVDLGSGDIIAAKATGAENVVRVKAAIKRFESETNLAVITSDGSFYNFNVRYADEPLKLSVEMKDFMHDGEAVNRPHNAMEIYLTELANESPKLVNLINRSIHKNDRRYIKHIGSKRFGIQYLLKGIFTHNSLLYLHTQITNESNVPFEVDFVRMKIVDKKVVKRTAIQETVIYPIRAYNYVRTVKGKRTECTVFAIDRITIPDDKQLIIELFEKNGGRHQEFTVENSDIVRARVIDELKVK
jgi:conjugative transposon TraN protein